MHLRSMSVFLLAAAATLAAADNPFVGKWKENLAQDDYVDATVSYEQTPPGEMQVTAEGHSYKFRMDGKEYPTGFGSLVAWKQVDESTWETVRKTNGILDWVATTRLSPNGKTLMVTEKGKRSDGEPFEDNEPTSASPVGLGSPGSGS